MVKLTIFQDEHWRIRRYYALHWPKRYRRILNVNDYLHHPSALPHAIHPNDTDADTDMSTVIISLPAFELVESTPHLLDVIRNNLFRCS
jgi:hypothetical protein